MQISDSFRVSKKVPRPQSDLGPIYSVNKQIITGNSRAVKQYRTSKAAVVEKIYTTLQISDRVSWGGVPDIKKIMFLNDNFVDFTI